MIFYKLSIYTLTSKNLLQMTDINFYEKIRKEYQKAAKPFIYEFSLTGQQPKQKKFRIMLIKLIEVLHKDMKKEYLQQQTNYWGELEKHLGDQTEMAFIKSMFEQAKKKELIYFALLLHNKRLFSTYLLIYERMPFLYHNPQEKIAKFNAEINEFVFLKDGQFIVDSKYIREDYNTFREQRLQEQMLLKKDVRSTVEGILESIQSYFSQIEKKKEEAKERKRLQEQEKVRKEIQVAEKEKKKVLQQQEMILNSKKEKEKQETKVTKVTKVETIMPPVYNMSNESPPSRYKEQMGQTKVENIKRKPKHMKNSQILFVQKYKDELEVFSFRLKPDHVGNKQVCFQCKQKLSLGLFFIGSNINYCEYTGEYFCNEHTADERIPIPYKAKEQFDLRGYSVSIDSMTEIKCLYDKPLIQIKNDDALVKKNPKLYEFFVFKRQLHLMYDTICNSELVDKMFGNKINYCLKDNHFSLKNLYDIYNGHEIANFQRQFQILTKHFYSCQTCQDKKGRICQICNHPPKIFSFEIRETYCCTHCFKISHRRCLTKNKCPCEQTLK